MFFRSSRHAVSYIRPYIAPASEETLSSSLSPQRNALAHRYLTTDASRSYTRNRSRNRNDSQRLNVRSHPFQRSRLLDRERTHRKVLDVNSLGKPGQVLVLPLWKRRQNALKQAAAVQKQPDLDGLSFFLGEIDKEENDLSDADLSRHMEELRQIYHPGDKLHSEDWTALRQKVERSFTSHQLATYISQLQPSPTPSRPGSQPSESLQSGIWRPGRSFYLAEENLASRVARDQEFSGKKLLSEQILRDCWQLGVLDEVGQLDIELSPHAISLLLKSKRLSFEELAHSHGAKIDVTRSLNLVRVTGSQRSCESIREIIEDFVSQLREDHLNLSFLNSLKDGKDDVVSSSDLLGWAEATYGVAIRRENRQSQGTIYYPLENKTMADRARRDFDLAHQTESSTQIPFCTYVPGTQEANIYATTAGDAASWPDRKKSWFRWSMPSSTTEKLSAPLFNHYYLPLSSDILGLLRGPSSTNQDLIGNDVEESLDAVVGKCLFQRKPSMDETAISASRLGELSLRRIFTASAPRIVPFLRLLTSFPGSGNEKVHRIRLTPSSTNVHPVPPLELDLRTSDNGVFRSISDLHVRNIKAVAKETSMDYLLPENGLDIRFTRTVYRNIFDSSRRSGNDSSVPDENTSMLTAITDALAHVSIHPRNTLPVFISLPLPQKVVQSNSSKAGGAPTEIIGEYLFPPIENIAGTRIRLFDFLGEKLNYVTYEASPFFALRATRLSLDMDVVKGKPTDRLSSSTSNVQANSSEDTLQKEFRSFYRTACKMAFELGRADGKGESKVYHRS